jgi:hypothetical protein
MEDETVGLNQESLQYIEQEILGRTNLLLSLVRHGSH